MRAVFYCLAVTMALVTSRSSFAIATYPDCVAFLSRVDVTSETDRAQLASIRDEYAELARRLRKIEDHNDRNGLRMRRAVGENQIHKFKSQFSFWQRARLAAAAVPVLFQLPALINTTKMTVHRELSTGMESLPQRDKDDLSKLSETLEDMEIAGQFFAELAERAEALSATAAAKLGEY